ncbi:MAG: FAD-dependent oxidoreductase, partial [Candidatus Competibacterales bacterium]|nr:FAD-dependent oxidoreductase [Candidatus Competibacterales bacterium]
MNRSKLMLVVLIALVVAAFFALDLDRFLTLDFFKSQRAAIETFYQANTASTVLIYFAIYVVVTALSLPGAALMTLVGGAIFGLLWGTVIVSFASTIGATLAFLVARFLLRDMVQRRFGRNLRTINHGVEKDGPFYLFTLRLVPAFPFFVINLVMALTPLRTLTFYWVSQLGMLPGTLVYINAGTQLAEIDSPGGILSPDLILSFVLLGVFPLIAKKIVDVVKSRRALRNWPKPRRFDRNLVVIGAGSAGLVCAYIAATVRASVSLIEKHKMGGDCLNTGCVPSKALLRSAKFLQQTRDAEKLGFRSAHAEFDFADIMDRVQQVIRKVEPHDSIERYTRLGVDCIQGEAKITSPYTVEVGGRTLTTRNIVIATGARPLVPPIPGLDEVGYLTSDNLWELRELPRRLVVLGGGPIGSELTQAFARLGSRVTQVEMLERILPREDPEISQMVMERFRAEGVDLRTSHQAKAFQIENGEKVMLAEHNGR